MLNSIHGRRVCRAHHQGHVQLIVFRLFSFKQIKHYSHHKKQTPIVSTVGIQRLKKHPDALEYLIYVCQVYVPFMGYV